MSSHPQTLMYKCVCICSPRTGPHNHPQPEQRTHYPEIETQCPYPSSPQCWRAPPIPPPTQWTPQRPQIINLHKGTNQPTPMTAARANHVLPTQVPPQAEGAISPQTPRARPDTPTHITAVWLPGLGTTAATAGPPSNPGEHTSVRRPKIPTAHLSDYPWIRLF